MEKNKKKEIKGVAILIRVLKDGRIEASYQCKEANFLEISGAMAQIELVKEMLMAELKKVSRINKREGK